MSVDERFYEIGQPLSLNEIALKTEARLSGDGSRPVANIAAASSAQAGELCYHEGEDKDAGGVSPEAAACFVRESVADFLPEGVAALIVDHPRYRHTVAARLMVSERSWSALGSLVSPQADIAPDALVAANVCIAAGAQIGPASRIRPGAVIGPGVVIGAGCTIGANVTLQCAILGNDVTISSGARIGEAGFGVMSGPDGLMDAPQYGRVLLKDNVSIGANSCVDRGAFDDTILHENVKIDNLCQIGHNVVIGRNTAMAAFAGISGSVTIGEGSQFGGRVGIADHVIVGKNVKLGASAGLFRDVPDGETWGGAPAKPFAQWMRELVWVTKQVRGKKRK